MKNIYVLPREVPALVEWFKNFIGIDYAELDKDHPLYLYYKVYEKWSRSEFGKQPGNSDVVPSEVVDFSANFIKVVQIFQGQIGKSSRIKKQFINDLLDKDTCYGVFFEIRILTHFYKLGCEHLTYRDNNINGKNPDIMFMTKDLRRVFVECTRKHAKPERAQDEILLIEDLIRSVKDKAEKYKDLENPFIFAVHLPEVIKFDKDKFRKDLGSKLQEMFKDRIFKNVNYVAFSSYKDPVEKPIGIKGDKVIDTDMPRLQYPNGSVDSNLKADFYW